MKHLLTFALAVLFASILASAQSTPGTKTSSKAEQAILKLEDQFVEATLKSDAAALDKLLAVDYVDIVPDGSLSTKADDIRVLKTGELKFTELKLEDIKVRVYGNTAVVTCVSVIKGTFKGTDISGKYRGTDVFLRRNGEWKVISSQGTPIVSKKE